MTRSFIITLAIFLGVCSLAASNSAFKDPNQEVVLFYNIFKDWASQSHRQYGVEEMAIRFSNWKSNFDFVQEQNAQFGLTFKLEMNEFADMAPEEFSALHLGLNLDLVEDSRKNKTAADAKKKALTNTTQDTTLTSTPASNLPKRVDWRKAGAVTPVKNQGKCGGCWSFAASGALEGIHAIKNKKLMEFSVQQMIDCTSDYGNKGCDGGLMTPAYAYTEEHGIEPENGYEYAQAVGECKRKADRIVFKNTGYEEVESNNFKALKQAVARQPVSVGIEASSLTVQLYKTGVISTKCGINLDHAVLIVGYDTDKDGQEYWIAKNSWGPKWGSKGYFHIAMGDQNDGKGVCGINMLASYPTA